MSISSVENWREVSYIDYPPTKAHCLTKNLSLSSSQNHLQSKCFPPLQQDQLFADDPWHKWEALYTLALATGMKRGELLGLKWQDINVETGILQVRHVLSRVPTNMPEREHVYVEAEPKTQKSRRSVMIAPFALEALKKHRDDELEAKLKAGVFWQECDYVFCTLLGTHLNPNHVVEEFKKVLDRAGLPYIRFHDLCHSAATLLLSLGVHPKVVQELLGHTQISMTMDLYSHVLPGMQQDAMRKLDAALIQQEMNEVNEK